MKTLPLIGKLEAWVDDRDFERFGPLKWRVDPKGRVVRDGRKLTGRPGLVRLDRLILGATSSQDVKHRNNIRIDCRRENLDAVDRKPGRYAAAEDMSLCVLRFREAFPEQQKFGAALIRRQLIETWIAAKLTLPEFLDRINDWAAVRANIAPWDLANPAPVVRAKSTGDQRAPEPTMVLPEPSPHQRALVRAMQTPWEGDGTT